jgi:hypothetical protein
MFHRPSLGLGEIAWRWSFGFAAALLLILSFLEYLNTLTVSARDLFLLRTRQPFLISRAIANIVSGSAPRMVEAVIVLGLALAMAWIVLAALGRAVTLREVESCLREDIDGAPGQPCWRLGSLAGLNCLRVATTLAAVLGCLAAWLIAAAASTASDPSPGLAVLIFLMVAMLVWLAWSALNWLLSFATVFVVAAGENTFGAITCAVQVLRARIGPMLAASAWFGLAHLAAFVIASFAVTFSFAFTQVLPRVVVFGGVLLVTLLYFAVTDFLYMGRLSAYVAIVEGPDAFSAAEVPPPPHGGQPAAPSLQPETRVDPDELILSDLPAADEP